MKHNEIFHFKNCGRPHDLDDGPGSKWDKWGNLQFGKWGRASCRVFLMAHQRERGTVSLVYSYPQTWYRTWPQEGLCKYGYYHYCQQAIHK